MHFVNAKGILSQNNGMNVYRGCTHGCIYCDSRSLCYHMDHAFEDIEVKQNAPRLLEDKLRHKRQPAMISTGAMCDPYLHCEKELKLTRQCLEVIEHYGFGVSLLTKSDMVLRDMDILSSINKKAKAVVQMTLTTYDESLCKMIEPNVCTTKQRHNALKTLQSRGIPTVVWLSPILPFINDNDENLNGILDYCFDAGVKGIMCFGFGTTMREGSREHFYAALDRHFPGIKRQYISTFGNAYICTSKNAPQLTELFHARCGENGVMHNTDEIFAYLNQFPKQTEQLTMF